ncbi:DUF4931 domain-containing protein [Bacillus vallismortis]|uniref:DUF4931 domain-containing protein n=1 Tax=Bacillus vallismortis TaxID=72361 RepID=UPI00374D674A
MQKLYFSSYISSQKPETIVNKQNACPFCDRDNLSGILETDGDMIWLENKYPTIQDTYQTLIVETGQCDEDITTYSNKKMRRLIRFSLEKLIHMEKDPQYKSVILYKNHGPLSGGSIKHAHMQIVGLKHADYMESLSYENFLGIKVAENPNQAEFNLSGDPIMGFTEMNVIISDSLEHTDLMADYIQTAVTYLTQDFSYKCTSYNLFFYHTNHHIICKIVPRFVVSPFFVGYKIPQVSVDERLHEIKEELQKKLNTSMKQNNVL